MRPVARVKFTQYVVGPAPTKYTTRTEVLDAKSCDLEVGPYGVTATRGPHSTLYPWGIVHQVIFQDELPPPAPPVKAAPKARPRPPFQPKVVK